MKHPFFSRLSLAAALICAALPTHAGEKYWQAQDMRYGAALYEYFQGNHFNALSTLMVAKQRGGIRVHADNAALIEGGISLGFGLRQRAAQLFEQQLANSPVNDNDENVDRYRRLAWLKLAELNYLQGDWEQSAQQLQKSGAGATGLALNLALRSGELKRAAQLLQADELPFEQQALGHINLGAALARQQRFGEAITQYHTAAELARGLDNPGRELRILADKAHIGAGYAYALQQKPQKAAREFRQVRLHTPWADRALLGLGWAAINNGQYQSAIDALQFLSRRQPLSTEAQEALAALPYSYEKLQRPNAAMAAYQQAEQQYLSAMNQLHQLQTSLQSLNFSPAPQQGEAVQRYGWLEAAEAPQLLRNHLRYLRPILQSDQFQLRLSELRDLRQLHGVISTWRERLPLFEQLIVERGQRRGAIVKGYTSAEFSQRLGIARQTYGELENALARIRRDSDALALLDEDNEFLTLVRDAQQRYRVLARAGQTRPRQAQTLQRAHGILLWQASQNYHQNLWQKSQQLQQLGEQLQQADRHLHGADTAARRAPQLQLLQARVNSARPRLNAQAQRIDAASRVIEASIRRDVIAEVARQRGQIRQYLAHTRLAIARLQDAALQSGAALDDRATNQAPNQKRTQSQPQAEAPLAGGAGE